MSRGLARQEHSRQEDADIVSPTKRAQRLATLGRDAVGRYLNQFADFFRAHALVAAEETAASPENASQRAIVAAT